jgi:hypothetical protein
LSRVLLITHPEVRIDAAVPVVDWPLEPRGRERMRAFAAGPEAQGLRAVWSSRERKAAEAARILGDAVGVRPRELEQLGEHDRSATGYLPPELFEPAVKAFFADPLLSYRGWETAAAAQERIVDALETVLAPLPARRPRDRLPRRRRHAAALPPQADPDPPRRGPARPGPLLRVRPREPPRAARVAAARLSRLVRARTAAARRCRARARSRG